MTIINMGNIIFININFFKSCYKVILVVNLQPGSL